MKRIWYVIDRGLVLMVVGVVRIFAGKEKALEVYDSLTNSNPESDA